LCLIFFGRNRYIDRANQKIAKNKIHRRKTEKKRESQKQKANTKKRENKSQQIHNKKRSSGLKKLIRHAYSLNFVLDQFIIPSGPILKAVLVVMKNLYVDY
jgi:hypothetical protein